MATYYVRKSGSDANSTAQAQSPSTPWLTIDKAANEVAAADTVIVGAGVYRELVTIDTNGTSGSPITWIADVDGSRSGDAGLVIISAYANETSTATRTACLADSFSDVTYNTFQGFTFVGGTAAAVDFDNAGNQSYEGMIFEDCAFVPGHTTSDHSVFLEYNAVTAPTGDGIRFRRCMFQAGGLEIQYDEDATEKDWDIGIENCVFVAAGPASNSSYGIVFDRVSASTTPPGGVSITNCTFYGAYRAIYSPDAITTAPTATWDIRNCTFVNCNQAILYTTTDPFTSDYCTYLRCTSTYTNAGVNDRENVDDPGLFGGIGDWTLWRFWGWSPYRPFEPIALNDGSYEHALIGTANASDAPADDLYGSPRPMGPGTDNADDVGAVEARARLEQETTTVRTGDNSARIEGAGFHDFLIPVTAASTTVEIYARFDSTYAGAKPTIEVMNAPGVTTLGSDIMTGAANQWEAISVTFTPTRDGVARVRVASQDTSTGGEAFFDDLTIT